MAFSVITHRGVFFFFVCLCSIFRMFSADRKRVETALENCNLPSGRVRHQNTETPSLFLKKEFFKLSPYMSSEPASICIPLLYRALSLLSQTMRSFIFSIQPSLCSSSVLPKQQLIAALHVCLESYFLNVSMVSLLELT